MFYFQFGYTPLHVTTFKKNCLHVYDVMTCGADFTIKDQVKFKMWGDLGLSGIQSTLIQWSVETKEK